MNADERPIEFIVEAIVTGASGRFTVIGRCGDTPIRVDDRFDAVYRYKPRRYPDEMDDDPVRESQEPAELKVECIHAYERSLPILGQGMTGVPRPGRGWPAAGHTRLGLGEGPSVAR